MTTQVFPVGGNKLKATCVRWGVGEVCMEEGDHVPLSESGGFPVKNVNLGVLKRTQHISGFFEGPGKEFYVINLICN